MEETGRGRRIGDLPAQCCGLGLSATQVTPDAGDSGFYLSSLDVMQQPCDFVIRGRSLKYVIVELKADNQIEDVVVQAKKDSAQQIAVANGMEYRIIKSSDADDRHYRILL